MSDQANANWVLPASAPAVEEKRPGRTAADIQDWRQLTSKVAETARTHNWSKAEVARRTGMPEGTFSQWFSGSYAGRLDAQNTRIRQWLDNVEEMAAMATGIPASPGYVETRTAKDIMETLLFAQILPEMSIICLGAGMGKTFTCRRFCETRPHAYRVTMTPYTRTVHGMLVEIATALGVSQTNPTKLPRAIGEKLQRNGRQPLLIVDEAQNLRDEAIDQLRSFMDINECGIALVGNEEIYGRLAGRTDGPSFAQIKRRIGKKLRRLTPYPEDITAMIDAWGVEDEAARKLLTGIGMKAGALGQIDKTMRLAGIYAAGDAGSGGTVISERHIRKAWSNRGVED